MSYDLSAYFSFKSVALISEYAWPLLEAQVNVGRTFLLSEVDGAWFTDFLSAESGAESPSRALGCVRVY